mgnify:CR=1 FL=1
MFEQILKEYWSRAVGFLFFVVGIIFYVQSKRTDNVSNIQKIYAELIKDLKSKLNEVEQLKLKLEKMEVELEKLRLENEQLRSRLKQY